MIILGEKFQFSRQKFLITFFKVIDQIFQIFHFFSQIFPMFAMLNVILTPFFTLFILSRASDNTTSLNIGGTNAWAVPHLKYLGDRPPSPPRSPPLTVILY